MDGSAFCDGGEEGKSSHGRDEGGFIRNRALGYGAKVMEKGINTWSLGVHQLIPS